MGMEINTKIGGKEILWIWLKDTFIFIFHILIAIIIRIFNSGGGGS